MLFDWDPAKDERNRQERGFGFDLAALIFEAGTIEWPDERKDYGEVRVRALGSTEGLVIHVVFTDRGDVRRIISARLADRKERMLWHGRR
ncbi:MAG: BrnT family toxin [Janthinobacterium lividum]